MARWTQKTNAYDYDDELMVKGGLMMAGIDYIKKLEKEEQILINSFLEVDESKRLVYDNSIQNRNKQYY